MDSVPLFDVPISDVTIGRHLRVVVKRQHDLTAPFCLTMRILKEHVLLG